MTRLRSCLSWASWHAVLRLVIISPVIFGYGCAYDAERPKQRPSTVSMGSQLPPARYLMEPSEPVSLDIPDLTSSAVIDRVVMRHRQQQASLAADQWGQRRGKKSRHGSTRAAGRTLTAKSGAGGRVMDVYLDGGCARQPGGLVKVNVTKGLTNCRDVDAFADAPKDDFSQTTRAYVRQGDTWDTVRSGLRLANLRHERLDAHLNYLRQRPGTVEYLMARAEPYLPYLVDQIRRQGLPSDLVLVPMVESAFQTTAVSSKQAAGLWQFIRSTGQQYGLSLTESYDGRYDTHLATQAALRYLKHLSGLFNGDWLLSLAAYNAGEGTVQRAIQANRIAGGAGTFWELDLPSETQNYVVKIVALSKVIADPVAHGFQPRKGAPQNTLARIEVRPEVHVSELIKRSGMAAEEFYRLNPAFKPDVELPDEPHNFLLPLEKAEILMAAHLPGAKVFAPRKIVVQKGDTLTLIAQRHGVPEIKLVEWNGLTPKTPLKVGQEILVHGV